MLLCTGRYQFFTGKWVFLQFSRNITAQFRNGATMTIAFHTPRLQLAGWMYSTVMVNEKTTKFPYDYHFLHFHPKFQHFSSKMYTQHDSATSIAQTHHKREHLWWVDLENDDFECIKSVTSLFHAHLCYNKYVDVPNYVFNNVRVVSKGCTFKMFSLALIEHAHACTHECQCTQINCQSARVFGLVLHTRRRSDRTSKHAWIERIRVVLLIWSSLIRVCRRRLVLVRRTRPTYAHSDTKDGYGAPSYDKFRFFSLGVVFHQWPVLLRCVIG